jgi:hypothetical protein
MRNMDKEQNTFNRAWSKVISKAWNDPAFKKRLLNEPQKVLRENGIELPSGKELKITETTDKIIYLNLPADPGKELQNDMLKNIVAGGDPITIRLN